MHANLYTMWYFYFSFNLKSKYFVEIFDDAIVKIKKKILIMYLSSKEFKHYGKKKLSLITKQTERVVFFYFLVNENFTAYNFL